MLTRHKASTSMYSLTFYVRARRPRPDGRSHYVVISRDGRKLVTRVCVMFHSNATSAPTANPPNSAQLGVASTTPQSYIRARAVVWAYVRGRTDRHTDARDHNTYFASSTTHAKCKYMRIRKISDFRPMSRYGLRKEKYN